MRHRHVEGSFADNLATGLDALGFDQHELAWGLAGMTWESREDRTEFFDNLTAVPAEEAALSVDEGGDPDA